MQFYKYLISYNRVLNLFINWYIFFSEYHKIFDCIQAQGIRVKGCTDKHLEISADYIKSHFSNALDLMCGDYSDSSDKCDTVPKLSKRKKNQRRTKSFVMPLVKLLKDLPEVWFWFNLHLNKLFISLY